jgi:TniQ
VTAAGRPETPLPLPVRPRPRPGETADSYLRRLATANHLHFSYLRRYLATPRGSFGPVDPGLLAALAGRERDAILRAFPELAPLPPKRGRRYYSSMEIERNRAARREKYAAIRRDLDAGMSERAIERKHHVGRRTIVKAIVFAEPPPRKKFQRDPRALSGLHALIDAMIEADPATRVSEIWQHLADDHGATVTYAAVRAYVIQQRANLLPPPSGPS